MTQFASIVASLCLVLDRQLPTPLFRQLYAGLRVEPQAIRTAVEHLARALS